MCGGGLLRWSVCTPAASGRRSVCWPSAAGLTESPEDGDTQRSEEEGEEERKCQRRRGVMWSEVTVELKWLFIKIPSHTKQNFTRLRS